MPKDSTKPKVRLTSTFLLYILLYSTSFLVWFHTHICTLYARHHRYFNPFNPFFTYTHLMSLTPPLTHLASHSVKPPKRPKRRLVQLKQRRTKTLPNERSPHICSSPRTGGRGSRPRTPMRALVRWASCWEPSGRSWMRMRRRYVFSCSVLRGWRCWVYAYMLTYVCFIVAVYRASGER